MAKPLKKHGDIELNELFDAFDAQLVSPGGAAPLLGVTRDTIYTLCRRGELRLFKGPAVRNSGGDLPVKWGFIPLQDVAIYADRVGRLTPMLEKLLPPGGKRTGPTPQ
jgi:hypothetical protein